MGHVRIYEYDPWGKCTIVSDTSENNLGKLNPFRYRGYYYDEETGFYYLQSRYYDCNICKFINADDPSILLADPYNVQCVYIYDYCENSPIINIDPTGYKMQIAKTDRDQMFKVLKKLTKHTLSIDKSGNVKIKKYATSNSMYKKGNVLISRLINSKSTVDIRASETEHPFTISYDSSLTGKKGKVTRSTIYLNPNTKFMKIPCKNVRTQVVSLKNTPMHIVLAHELIHADRFMRGVAFPDSQIGSFTYLADKYKIGRNSTMSVYRTEYPKKEELATVGLKYNKSNDITENQIRKEHGLCLRGAYL